MLNAVQSNPNPDFVELYNNGADPIDLGGWKLIDDGVLADAFIIPAGTTIAPGEFLVIEGNGSQEETPLKLPFGLGGGDAAMLYTACDDLVDSYTWDDHVMTASAAPMARVTSPRRQRRPTAQPTPANKEGRRSQQVREAFGLTPQRAYA